MEGDVVSVERTIPAPAAAIFDLLADPTNHPVIDGSGTVKRSMQGPKRLTLGDTFGMSMKLGIAYSMVNTVVECEENKRIAWQARPRGFMGKISAGRIWRYELEPDPSGGTRVRESWDISQDKQKAFLRRGRLPEKTRENMADTLARIADLLAPK